ncbi:MAG: peptidase [Rhodospirillaceae bacterium]|nr:peptidase [Rhodospirillaceae bacterium]|tara:strand:+ start:1118 stop:1921 length:804 start_codon:yes stop_codon:yes gene_type:complete
MFYFPFVLFLFFAHEVLSETTLKGNFIQGGLVFGVTNPKNYVTLDGRPVRISDGGHFIFGFSRDSGPETELIIHGPRGSTKKQSFKIKRRKYRVQRIDGLPRHMVTPPKDVLSRIRKENDKIREARMNDSGEPHFMSGFIMPAIGRISGVYGSQRILNGKPKQPHFGIDIAAPSGTKVVAPADGVVVLAETDFYYSGGTVILDHGHGLTSAFLHLKELFVKKGDFLAKSDVLGSIGDTGRVTGPHLDWRVNWFERRIDPGLLVKPNN